MSKKVQKPKRDKSQEKLQKVSEQIQVILLKNNLALKPLMTFSQEGIIPQVRLVEINQENDAIDNTNQGETGESQEGDKATEPKQS